MKVLACLLVCLIVCVAPCVKAQSKSKEKPYTVFEKGSYMSKVDVRKNNKGTENIVQIEALNASGGLALASGPVFRGAAIGEVVATQGNYNMIRQITKSGRGQSIQLMDVVFPVRLRISISGEYLDLEIKEAGFWKVMVAMTN